MGENMVEVTKLVNIMLIFLTLFVVALSIDSKPFYILFKSLSLLTKLLRNVLSNLIYTIYIFITEEYTVCSLHSDCQAYVCQLPLKPECILLEYVPHFYRLTCSCV